MLESTVDIVRDSWMRKTALDACWSLASNSVPAIPDKSWYGSLETTSESTVRWSSVKAGIPSNERVSQSRRSGNLVTGRFFAFLSSCKTVPETLGRVHRSDKQETLRSIFAPRTPVVLTLAEMVGPTLSENNLQSQDDLTVVPKTRRDTWD